MTNNGSTAACSSSRDVPLRSYAAAARPYLVVPIRASVGGCSSSWAARNNIPTHPFTNSGREDHPLRSGLDSADGGEGLYISKEPRPPAGCFPVWRAQLCVPPFELCHGHPCIPRTSLPSSPFVLARAASVAVRATSVSLYNFCPWPISSCGVALICRAALMYVSIRAVCSSMAFCGRRGWRGACGGIVVGGGGAEDLLRDRVVARLIWGGHCCRQAAEEAMRRDAVGVAPALSFGTGGSGDAVGIVPALLLGVGGSGDAVGVAPALSCGAGGSGNAVGSQSC